MNVLVMFDRETNSLWSQLLGEAVEGPLEGTKLEFVPAVHTKWADWKEQYPDTRALVKGFSGSYTSYSRYYTNNSAGKDYTYKSDGAGSQINVGVPEDKRWPGPIIETNEGIVVFSPVAEFSFSPVTGPAPLEVQFTDLSTGTVDAWNWFFGDQGFSNEKTPKFTFENAGKFEIQLKVFNNAGFSEKIKTITIM